MDAQYTALLVAEADCRNHVLLDDVLVSVPGQTQALFLTATSVVHVSFSVKQCIKQLHQSRCVTAESKVQEHNRCPVPQRIASKMLH